MVDKKKVFFIGSGILIMGSLSWAASTMPQAAATSRVKSAVPGFQRAVNAQHARPVAPPVVPGSLALVPPPAELPSSNAPLAITSVKPAGAVVAATAARPQPAKKAAKQPESRVKAATAMASVKKTGNLFSYVRMLNYSPHPQEEEFLRDKPLVLNGHRYWLKVSYKESWDVVDDETGSLKNIGFGIKLMEGDKVVRDLRIPGVKLDTRKLKRGQVLGIAEVAPYKFNIAVDEFKVIGGGLSELVFKFDLKG